MVCKFKWGTGALLKPYDISEMFGFSVEYGSYRIWLPRVKK